MASSSGANFRLRQAKGAQRNMMADLLQRIEHIKPLDYYQYVGFGSEYYSDFRLFHRRFGFRDMTCIEKTFQKEERMIFNRPYGCIKLVMGRSDEALPSLDLSDPTVLWLDYPNELKEHMLESDLPQFFADAPVGSMVFITLDIEEMRPSRSGGMTILEKYADQIGREYIPTDLRGDKSLRHRKYSLFRQILLNAIEAKYLDTRNVGKDSHEELEFKQLVHFHYDDSKHMMTLGGMLYSDEIQDEFRNAGFEDLEFLKRGSDFYFIPTPELTMSERRRLDEELPGLEADDLEDKELDFLPPEEVEDYTEVYRFLPRFVDSDM